jgi:hypothetical protein
MGVLTAYARTLSDGMRMSVRVDSPAAQEKYEAGKALFFRRIGQLNAACAGCHLVNAGNIMRMEILSPALGHATHWPIFRGGEELMTFQGRFALHEQCVPCLRVRQREWKPGVFPISATAYHCTVRCSASDPAVARREAETGWAGWNAVLRHGSCFPRRLDARPQPTLRREQIGGRHP